MAERPTIAMLRDVNKVVIGYHVYDTGQLVFDEGRRTDEVVDWVFGTTYVSQEEVSQYLTLERANKLTQELIFKGHFKETEIEGPHGCGVYGHNHYGLTRADVIFALEAEKAHIVNLNKCIHSFNEDGLISDTTHQMALNKLAEFHKLLHSEMMEVLNRGDEINMESR